MTDEQPKQPVTVNRDALYAQVWDKPRTRLAAEYGISGTDLPRSVDGSRSPSPRAAIGLAKPPAPAPPELSRELEAALAVAR